MSINPTSDEDRIRGKVAAILSKREIIMTIGSAHGVEIGMKFVVLNSSGIDVRDPDTGETLESIEVPKTVVKVVRVSEKVSVGRTFRTIPGRLGIFGSASTFTGTPSRVETLDVQTSSTLKHELSEEDSYVKSGDLVVQTTGDEYDDL